MRRPNPTPKPTAAAPSITEVVGDSLLPRPLGARSTAAATRLSVMPKPDEQKIGRLVWFVPPIALVSAVLGNLVGDMILICAVYGPQAYFAQGLRIVKHKPFTLSTGVVLSEHLNEVGWLLSATLWLGLTILFVWILTRVFSAFGRGRDNPRPAPAQ
jgi:hypothetical protein